MAGWDVNQLGYNSKFNTQIKKIEDILENQINSYTKKEILKFQILRKN